MTITLKMGDALGYLRGLPDESVDLILTDPPYGISFKSNMTDKQKPIANDGWEDAIALFKAALPEFKRVLKETGSCLVFCGGGGSRASTPHFTLAGQEVLELVTTLVWSKGKTDGSFIGLGWRYRPSYETCIVFAKNCDEYAWFGGHAVSNVLVCKPHIPQADNGDHPTQKPLPLIEKLLRLHTRPGMTVLDPFMGCGTTGVACIKNKRNFIGFEIDEGYFETAQKRIKRAENGFILDWGHDETAGFNTLKE